MDALLEWIQSPSHLKKLSRESLTGLAVELRERLIQTVSQTGGHFSSNLGTVELTIALHYVYNTPDDRLVWDVGHQTYPHKILTGRNERMSTLRQQGGLSGFPRREESVYDAFGTAHSSTSISAAFGMAVAAKQTGSQRKSVAIIGEVRGKNVLLVDDLTETAGTLTKGAELLKKKGAKRIIACVSHAILGDQGIERLRKSAIDELITTDTVTRPAIRGVKITTLSVAGLLGEAIKRIHNNSSVTSLFESKGGRTS
jgi:hypothetical protein